MIRLRENMLIGRMRFNGQEYTSPSGAGKNASGWKAVNGWTYWHFLDEEAGEWVKIEKLRKS
ncbi:MAG: hypothetical protein QNJ45_11655 [Ardenticatenaceae bacterium]|nr:hypothetical protein [Ardenticatenaceae bacterium]